MSFYVYLIKTINRNPIKTYVGYTNNIKLRLNAHNANKGAKSTKGYKWELIYKKSFKTKSAAMSYEYKFKKDRKKRLSILKSKNDWRY